LAAVESSDRVVCLLGGAHGDKGETTGTICGAVHHDPALGHGSKLRERILQTGFCGVKRQVSYEESHATGLSFLTAVTVAGLRLFGSRCVGRSRGHGFLAEAGYWVEYFDLAFPFTDFADCRFQTIRRLAEDFSTVEPSRGWRVSRIHEMHGEMM
jgi:hypothetical protein